ncbi:hypothetical protein CHUAL_001303 [Chamberlinius hualienensis]
MAIKNYKKIAKILLCAFGAIESIGGVLGLLVGWEMLEEKKPPDFLDPLINNDDIILIGIILVIGGPISIINGLLITYGSLYENQNCLCVHGLLLWMYVLVAMGTIIHGRTLIVIPICSIIINSLRLGHLWYLRYLIDNYDNRGLCQNIN